MPHGPRNAERSDDSDRSCQGIEVGYDQRNENSCMRLRLRALTRGPRLLDEPPTTKDSGCCHAHIVASRLQGYAFTRKQRLLGGPMVPHSLALTIPVSRSTIAYLNRPAREGYCSGGPNA
jgi:hypothetical protein